MVGFPNFSKIIATYHNKGFTASLNCWARIDMIGTWTSTNILVNGQGIAIQQIQGTNEYPVKSTFWIPLKKGDIVTLGNITGSNSVDINLHPFR